jgi:hypothetical protein
MYTLFQMMTLESRSIGIVRPVVAAYPWAWAFFVLFIIVTAFAVLNLFVAIIVNAMSEEAVAESTANGHADTCSRRSSPCGRRSQISPRRLRRESWHASRSSNLRARQPSGCLAKCG